VERGVSVRVAGKTRCAIDPKPAQDQRLTGAEGMTVDAQPDPPCRRDGRDGRGRRAAGNEPSVEKGSGAIEIEGNCHFELVASPRIAWTGILQASNSEASSVQVSAPSGGYCT